MPINICPKCRYQRQVNDTQVHPDLCLNCGIVYSKWIALQNAERNAATIENIKINSDHSEEEYSSLRQQLSAAFTYVPERIAIEAFWARVITLVGFTLWGGYFISAGVDWEKLGSSFMHNINLPFHEFGHVLFMPFGHFMMILGGSLFQIILPLVLLLLFIFKQRDTFAASIMLWWCGQSFIDLSPYIADAQYRALPLVGGGGEKSHDWGNLLTMMDALEHTQTVARTSFVLGAFLIIVAILWSGFILNIQKKNITRFHE